MGVAPLGAAGKAFISPWRVIHVDLGALVTQVLEVCASPVWGVLDIIG